MTTYDYLWDLFRKTEAERKKGHWNWDCIVQLPTFSGRCREFKPIGITLFIAIWAVWLVLLQTLDATITDTFSEPLKHRNINNSFRNVPISFKKNNMNCSRGAGFCRVILFFACNIFLYIMFPSWKLRLSFSLFKSIYWLDAQHCFLPLVKKKYWMRPFHSPMLRPHYFPISSV